eukprot:scaffold5049_cov13-Tisochrysis_lutea.AAC.1
MPPVEPDTSSGSVGSNGHCASRPDTSPRSSHGDPACIQPSAPGSPGFCPSLLPRAVDPCTGPGRVLVRLQTQTACPACAAVPSQKQCLTLVPVQDCTLPAPSFFLHIFMEKSLLLS